MQRKKTKSHIRVHVRPPFRDKSHAFGCGFCFAIFRRGKEQGHEPKKIGIQTANFLPAAAPGNAAPFLWGNSRGP